MTLNQPDVLFDDRALDTFESNGDGPLRLTAEVELSHAVARGIEATIRLVRANSVNCALGHSPAVGLSDIDALLALVGNAAGMLAERAELLSDWASSSGALGGRLESLSQHEPDESRRMAIDEQSSRGNA